MAALNVRCTCGRGLRLHSRDAGQTGRCPNCRRSITVPPADVFEGHDGLTVEVDDLSRLSAAHSAPHAQNEQLWRPGQVVQDRYEVVRKLGEGSFGAVWLFRHLAWDMKLAVKQLPPGREHSERHRELFVREANAWVELGMHPNVITAWYVDDLNDGNLYLFLEYADGGDLAGWIAGERTRDLAAALDIAIQLCRGLEHCHTQELVHRDFKPLNVMMTDAGAAKVTDFGTVKFAGMSAAGDDLDLPAEGLDLRRTIGGELQGSKPYMPPEQWVKVGPLDHRADLYALGVSIHELLTGTHPIRAVGGSLASWMLAHAQSPPRPLRMDREDAPEALERLVLHCLAKRPADRPGSAGEVADRLEVIYHKELGQPHPRPRPNAVELRAEGLNNRAVTLVYLGRETNVKERSPEDLLEEALRVDPHYPEAVYNLGLLKWRAGRLTPDQFVKQLRDVQQDNHADWRAPYLLGRVFMESGEVDRAITALTEAAGLQANNTSIQSSLRAVYEHRKSWGGQLLQSFAIDQPVAWARSVAFSPDGQLALTGGSDGAVRLWNVASGRLVRKLEGHEKPTRSVAFSPDGQLALTGGSDGAVRLWNVASGRLVRKLEGRVDEVISMDFTCAGQYILAGGSNTHVSDGGMRTIHSFLWLWEVGSGELVRTVELQDSLRLVAFSPDGRLALTVGSTMGLIRLCEADSGRLVRTFTYTLPNKYVTPYIKTLAFSHDGRLALSNHGNLLLLWEVDTGRLVRILEPPFTSHIETASFTPDGRFALSGGSKGSIQLWEIDTGRLVRTFENFKHERVYSLASSPDSRLALYASYNSDGKTIAGGTIQLWEVGMGDAQGMALDLPRSSEEVLARANHVLNLKKEAQNVLSISPFKAYSLIYQAMNTPGFSKDPDLLALRYCAGVMGRVASISSWWTARTFDAHARRVFSVAFSPDNRFALSGAGGYVTDSVLHLWEVCTGRLARAINVPRGSTVHSVAFSPDGQYALSGGENGSLEPVLHLWEVCTGRLARAINLPRGSTVHSVAFSPDGQYALSGGLNGPVRLWEVCTGRLVRAFEGPKYTASSVAFSPDGQYALSGGSALLLWEACTGRLCRTLHGHVKQVRSVAFSPDGRLTLTGGDDGKVLLWEVCTGRLVRAFEGPKYTASSVAFSPDGQYALSGGDDAVWLWEVATGRLWRGFERLAGYVNSVAISSDGVYALSGGQDGTVVLHQLVWDYEFPEPIDWDEAAEPYLKCFMMLLAARQARQTGAGQPAGRGGILTWSEDQFQELLGRLRVAGYGWLQPEGVRRELERMAANWQDPGTAQTAAKFCPQALRSLASRVPPSV